MPLTFYDVLLLLIVPLQFETKRESEVNAARIAEANGLPFKMKQILKLGNVRSMLFKTLDDAFTPLLSCSTDLHDMGGAFRP